MAIPQYAVPFIIISKKLIVNALFIYFSYTYSGLHMDNYE